MQKDNEKPTKKTSDPNAARFLRKQYQKDGVDEAQDLQDAKFMSDPSISLNKYAKKKTQKNLEKQVQYFGHAIQPFHMRQEQNMGNIDEQGFFVFNRKKGVRDAWLDSINQEEDADVADKLVKKIKTQGRFQTVYEAHDRLNEDLKNQYQQQQEESQKKQQQQEQNQEQQENGIEFETNQLIEMMIQFIPTPKMNANNYMKKLKQQKKMQEYNKLLTISNEYVQKTGQYDILTKKKFQLQNMLEELKAKKRQDKQSEELNWDEESKDEQINKTKQVKENNQQNRQGFINCQPQIKDDDEDDIF